MSEIFWISLFALIYIYFGYLKVLELLLQFKRPKSFYVHAIPSEKVTILITAYNEETTIVSKINNVLEEDYPSELLEVIVASDMSTDATDQLVLNYNDKRVSLFRPQTSQGKTDTQNQAVSTAQGDIIIYTDAETRFNGSFIRHVTAPFKDSNVGCVTGKILFSISENSTISVNQGRYWRYETAVRQAESDLGFLATATGAAMAVRKTLIWPMKAAYGEDCILPLDVALAGKRVIQSNEAIGYDTQPHDTTGEFKCRVRMTLRNLQGIFSKKTLLNVFRHPWFSFSLISHKILRWLSPLFLIGFILSSLLLADKSLFYLAAAVGSIILCCAATIGAYAQYSGKSLPVVQTVYSFFLANAGFLAALLLLLRNRKITKYGETHAK